MTVSTVSVIGAGTMGYGLATHLSLSGMNVTLIDHRQSNLDRAAERINEAVTFLDEESLATADPEEVVDDVTYTLDRSAGVADADLVLETISEDIDAKQKLFRDVGGAAPDDAILASNTSGIRITRLAEGVPDYEGRIVGCHWWNPPYLMPLVEIVRGERTSDATVSATRSFVEDVDRTPVVVEKDVPGFVWNRIQFAVLRECMHLFENDVASLDDIEAAVRDGYALRTATVGPFETVDLAGLDLFRTIAGDLYPHLSDTDEPGETFEEYLDRGRTGVESGAGFHEYADSSDEVRSRRDRKIAALRRALDWSHGD